MLQAHKAQKQNSLFNADKEIAFGISGSFTGHFGYYGNAIKHGIESYFEQINKQGGIQGKKLKLIGFDDNSDPQKTKKNVEDLMHQGITMFIGIMGTRGMLSILPLIKEKKIAVFFAWGGDPKLRDSSLTHIINGPGLLEPQLDALAKYVADTLHLNQIGIFYADDDFSTDGASYLKKILEKNKISIAESQAYDRFIMNIYDPTLKLIKANPRVIISIATSLPTAKMIDQFFTSGAFGTYFLGIDSTFLVNNFLRDVGVSFKYSSAVPDPHADLVIAKDYRNAMASFFPVDDISILSFSYYISAAIIVDAMNKIKGAITKEEILKNIEEMQHVSIKGFPVNFNEHNRHIFGEKVWII
jgi:ABC-type branched-subunit amino acid transport system substrate-binding protein